MDRFVWFVLLVVFSHLVTEFTRVTGYTRGTRHDSVMVNDSLIQPIRVQNQIQYPGQEYGHYAQPSPPFYSGNSHYNNYDNNPERNGNNYSNSNTNNANSNNNNLFSNFFSGLFNQNSNTNSNSNNNNNNNKGQEYPQANSNIDTQQQPQADVRTFGIVQPIIDSIFEIPISTLRAVNNLVGRLTFSYRQQQQQQQPQQQQQQQGFSNHLLPHQQYSPSYPSSASASASASASPSYYGMQKSATIQPKSEFEMLKRIRQIGNSNGNSENNNDPQQQQLGPIRASL